jgi:hypothetical protein
MPTARSKRSHASGKKSVFSGADRLVMTTVPEGPKKPNQATDKYLRAVGFFVTMFSLVENKVQEVLWHFTKIDPIIARCIFSGTRTEGAIGYIKRIAEATKWPAGQKHLLDHLASQLGEITQLRNDLLHFGTRGEDVADLLISNEALAHIESRIRATKISASILQNVSADLLFILVLLNELLGKHEWKSPMQGVMPGSLLKVAWRYKPERPNRQGQKLPDQPLGS